MRTEFLKEKLAKLNEKLGVSLTNNSEDVHELVSQIKDAEKQVKELELITKIKNINSRDKIHRELLAEFLEVGAIDPELITNDNKLHKTKRKQNEKLYTFIEKHGGYFKHEYDNVIKVIVNNGRQPFELQNTWVEYSNGNKELKSFTSVEEICKYKGILLNDLKVSDAKKRLAAIDKATAKLKQALELYGKETDAQGRYWLEKEGFLNVYGSRNNEYTSRF